MNMGGISIAMFSKNQPEYHSEAYAIDSNRTSMSSLPTEIQLRVALKPEDISPFKCIRLQMNKVGSSSMGLRRKIKEVTPEKLSSLKEELKQLVVSKHVPLPDEPDYSTCDDTLTRFLRARKYSLKDAYKQLSEAIEWRRTYRPRHVDCKWCTDQPGFHGIRQVGFDPEGRPVLYACFAQCQTLRNTAEDTIAHVVYLVENALRCPVAKNNQWVIVIDCTGLTLPCCNPKLGKQFSQTFGNNYPEHLYRFFLVHHNPALHGIWKAIRVFVDPNTAKKVKLVKRDKISLVFDDYFGPELSSWLKEELSLNQNDISDAQKRFWQGPSKPGTHDPRGTPSYVQTYIEPLEKIRAEKPSQLLKRSDLGHKIHLPHPNIVQFLNGMLTNVQFIDLKRKAKISRQEMEEYGVKQADCTESDEESVTGEESTNDEELGARSSGNSQHA
ncbi:Chromatin structure remodeling complex protein sfh1, variant 2 [Clonorchis sinensis]|uniref:Chromatin structure remodeling complex protein sfh1, variant 2 n=3 Tax=Clonorchis sinensis TaxID=79923 RepID=A0A8T1N0W8_CLOSI|nr:Chromatin structure remodeling complex protein sfh1, variant 2 [Clonorchis sinensis]